MESIAIIGMGCRFPGAESPRELWRLLREGRDAIGEVPSDRWDLNAFYDEDPAAPGKMYTRWGGFLQQVDGFDAAFFGISPREAVHMDPQQRMLLEVVWEALEDAGQVREALAGKPVGVFVGISTFDYACAQLRDARDVVDGYLNTGGALSIAANRISYFFDFRGPSLAVDTACSSSLVSTHLACQSLLSGESTLALAGGVNVILSPTVTVGFSKLKAMAPDGRCKAFDARADGFVRSEGAGMLVLKTLSRAVEDGDPIYGVIRATAINQDGRTNGLTAPNGLSQQSLLRRVLERAAVAPGRVSYVEAHGTGTALGDPIEVNALGAVLSEGRAPDGRCAVGSVKTNLGHLEAAAGVAGLMKVALALKHGEIPASLHFETPNPHIPFDHLPFYVPRDAEPWRPSEGSAIATVSSFGFGGTNGCAVLEEAPPMENGEAEAAVRDEETQAQLFTLSARGEDALRAFARSYVEALGELPLSETPLADVCFTAGAKRTHHERRLAVVAQDGSELRGVLEAFLDEESRPGLASGRARARGPKTAFVFSGHGSQRPGMARELLESEPVFREALERADKALREHTGWSVVETLLAEPPSPDLERVEIIQPCLFAIQVALAAFWRALGVEPKAVVGHSMGEIAAAHVAGSLSLAEAARVMAFRAELLASARGRGAMTLVELSLSDAERAIEGHEGRVSVAASNSRGSTVLSGDPEAVAAIAEKLAAEGVLCRAVDSDVAFHSPQMDPLAEALGARLEGLAPRPAALPFYSTVMGKKLDGAELGADYWRRNLREPVRFSSAVERLAEQDFDAFVELSPHPVLLASIRKDSAAKGATVVPSLKRGQDERAQVLRGLAKLYTLGQRVAWSHLYPRGRRMASLPSYPWQRTRYWLERSEAVQETAPVRTDVASAFYDGLSQSFLRHHDPDSPDSVQAYLTFAPFDEVQPDFSWLLAFYQPDVYREQASRAHEAQIEMRRVLFDRVNFPAVRKALDFGCGYGSDVVTLAERHPELKLHGYTISPEQAEIANRKIGARGLRERVRVFNRDSAKDEFPDQYELVFGFEVAGHIPDKDALFGNVGGHVANGGFLLVADFVSNLTSSIDHGDTAAYTGTAAEWAEALARHGLRTLECVDLSEEIANFLYDDRFDEHLEQVASQARIDDVVKKTLRSYENIGKALRRKLLSYVLLVVQKDEYLSRSDIGHINAEAFRAPTPYRVARQRIDAKERSGEDALLYQIRWERREPAPASTTAPGKDWLLFADRGGVVDELARMLRARGEEPTLVRRGEAFERTPEEYRLRPERLEDVERLLEDTGGSGAVVYGFGLDAAAPEGSAEAVSRGSELACAELLALCQGLGRRSTPPARLTVLTRGAQPAEGGAVEPVAASLWGLGRVVAREHPEIWGGLVDLSPESTPASDVALLAKELGGKDPEVAFREGGRLVPCLVRSAPTSSEDGVDVVPEASYLITGGMGALGLLVARFLVGAGARHLILAGRTELPPRPEWSHLSGDHPLAGRVAAVSELEALGAEVRVRALDVADEAQMDAFARELETISPPVRGVVHAAGVVRDLAVRELDREALSSVLEAKVRGSWLLHRIFEEAALDFFVMFSSASAVLGTPGQANYAAGNAFMDALAHFRRSRGLPAVSLGWGPWAGEGMAGRADTAARLAPFGVRAIAPERGLAVLRRVLRRPEPQLVVVDVDWERLSATLPGAGTSSLLSHLVSSGAGGATEGARVGSRAAAALLEIAPRERRAWIETHLRDAVAQVLGLSPDKVDREQPLSEMGLDSLMGVELKNRVEGELGVAIPLMALMQGASVERLAEILADDLEGKAAAAAEPGEEGKKDSLLMSLLSLGEKE